MKRTTLTQKDFQKETSVPVTYYTTFFLTVSQVLLLWTLMRY